MTSSVLGNQWKQFPFALNNQKNYQTILHKALLNKSNTLQIIQNNVRTSVLHFKLHSFHSSPYNSAADTANKNPNFPSKPNQPSSPANSANTDISMKSTSGLNSTANPKASEAHSAAAAAGGPHPTAQSHQHSPANSTQSSASHHSHSSAASASGHESPHPQATSHLYDVASDVSNIILTRLQLQESSRVVKGIVLVSIVMGVIGSVVYVFREFLKERTVTQVSDIAQRTLETDQVQTQVSILTHDLIRKLLTDTTVQQSTLLFVQRLLADDSTRQSVQILLQNLLNDSKTIVLGSQYAQKIAENVMNSPQTKEQLASLLRSAVLAPENKEALQILFKNFMNDEKTVEIFTEKLIIAAQNVLNDGAVKLNATEFAKSILNDATLQQTTGEALWGSVKSAFKPKWFSHEPTIIIPQAAKAYNGGEIVQITPANVIPSAQQLSSGEDIEKITILGSPQGNITLPLQIVPATPIYLAPAGDENRDGTDPFFTVPSSALQIENLPTEQNNKEKSG
jgi:hypothetical protein